MHAEHTGPCCYCLWVCMDVAHLLLGLVVGCFMGQRALNVSPGKAHPHAMLLTCSNTACPPAMSRSCQSTLDV
jgi:hypothetical protein